MIAPAYYYRHTKRDDGHPYEVVDTVTGRIVATVDTLIEARLFAASPVLIHAVNATLQETAKIARGSAGDLAGVLRLLAACVTATKRKVGEL